MRYSKRLPRLFRVDRFTGAHRGTRATVDALTCVDDIDIAGGDRLHGALVDAGSTSHTQIGNFVSHFSFVFND